MKQLSRRELCGLIAAAGLTAKEPESQFPTDPRARLSVSTYPFRRVIGKSQKLEDFARTIPSQFGVHGIEPWSHHFSSTDTEYVESLHSAFGSAGIYVVNIPVDIHADLCGTAEQRAKALAAYQKWVEAAVVLHSPGIRVHTPGTGKSSDISCAVDGLSKLAEYGASHNIVINLENDDPDTEQPERIVRIIKAVKSPYLRALPDFGNSLAIHDDQNYNQQALSMLFPLAYNICHVKNMLQDGKKIYRADVDRLFSIAKEARYKGYFSMEWDADGDPYAGTKHLIAMSLRNLG